MPKLILVIQDSLAGLAKKGEVVPRYYNPCDLFDDILVLGMHDRVPPTELQAMLGRARMVYRYIGKPSTPLLLVGSEAYLGEWPERALASFPRGFVPDAIRVYGPGVNGLLGLYLKKQFNTPLICSVHAANDIWRRLVIRASAAMKSKAMLSAHHLVMTGIETRVLKGADVNLAVYQAAADFVSRKNGKSAEILYNSVHPDIPAKKDYSLSAVPRLLNVGAQTAGLKEPCSIIASLSGLGIGMDVYGTGSATAQVAETAVAAGVQEQVRLISSAPNSEIVAKMAQYDIYVYRSHAPEISKSVIEALLAGLPVVVNENIKYPVPEFIDAPFITRAPDTPLGWRTVIQRLLADRDLRENMGRQGREFALKRFDPRRLEQAHAEIYRRTMRR